MPKHNGSSKPTEIPINVSARVLRHISRGIYRTSAGALKELVSNSYDAGARNVTVKTNWPTLTSIVLTDNGVGMTAEQFSDLVQHIGLSTKIAGQEFTLPASGVKRRTIGHYGIGLLAVGQLAGRMELTSKTKGSRRGFTAELDFEQFETATMKGRSRAVVEAEEKLEDSDAHNAEVFRVGRCLLTHNTYDRESTMTSFTRIELLDVRSEVHQRLSGALTAVNPKAASLRGYSANFGAVVETLTTHEPDATQGLYPYEKLLWELAVYCPLGYPELGPFKKRGQLYRFQQLAAAGHFDLNVDGFTIRKPFVDSFFSDSDYPVRHLFRWTNQPYTDDKKGPRASCYLVYKARVRPKVMQGILVRESGIAVGTYDTTFLQYPFNEGQKFNQLTGEIYASGLSGALNIDRNSFNETDDRFVALSRWLHKKLRMEVFPKIKELQKDPQSSRRRQNIEAATQILNTIAANSNRFSGVSFKGLGRDAGLFHTRGRRLVINSDRPEGSGSSAKQEKLLFVAAVVLTGVATPLQLDAVQRAIDETKG